MSGLYEVQRIIGKRIREGKNVEYKVKWKGYDASQSTWEPIKNLKTVDNMITEFEERNRDKLPQPSRIDNQNKNSKFGSVLSKKTQSKSQSQKLVSFKSQDVKNEKRIPNRENGRIKPSEELRQPSRRVTSKIDSQEGRMEEQNSENDGENGIDYQKVQMQDQNGLSEQKEEGLPNFNLDRIASKILTVVQEKRKKVKVVGVLNRQLGRLYLVQDAEGNEEYQSREYVMRNLSRELIDYYQSQIKFVPRVQ